MARSRQRRPTAGDRESGGAESAVGGVLDDDAVPERLEDLPAPATQPAAAALLGSEPGLAESADPKLELIAAAAGLCEAAERLPRAASRHAVTQLVISLRMNWRTMLKVSAACWAVSLLINVVLVRLVTGPRPPRGSPVIGEGNLLQGALFWTALTTVTTSIVSYRLRVGRERFRTELRAFPATIRALVRAGPASATSQLLWGFAGTMFFVILLSPSVAGVLAATVAFALVAPARSLVVFAATTTWRAVARTLPGMRTTPPAPVATVVAAAGGGGAFLLGALVAPPRDRFALAAVAVVVAVIVARRAVAPTVAAAAVVAIVVSPLILAMPASQAAGKTGVIFGTVTDEDRKPVSGVDVVANGDETDGDTTDNEGKFSITLPHGLYRVVPLDGRDEKAEFTPDYLDVDLSAAKAEIAFVLKKKPAGGGGGGGGEDATATTAAGDQEDEATADSEPPASTTAPPTTTRPKAKAPRTVNRGSQAVADFVIPAPAKKLKPSKPPTKTVNTVPTTAPPNPAASRSPSQTRTSVTAPPFELPPQPVQADCLVTRSPGGCYYDVGFIDFSLSPKLLKIGDVVTGSTRFDLVLDDERQAECESKMRAGYVEACPISSWDWVGGPGLVAIGGSPSKATGKEVELDGRKYDVVECLSGPKVGSGTCTWLVTASPGSTWITGSQIGAALLFPTGTYVEGDFYAVLPPEATSIEGTVRDQDGKPVPGVTVYIDGDRKYTRVTDSVGWYFALVEPGSYDVYVDVDPVAGVKIPGALPKKHRTKLEPGANTVADLSNGWPRPKLLALMGLMLAPLLPAGMFGQGMGDALSSMRPPGSMTDTARRLLGGGGGAGSDVPGKPKPSDYQGGVGDYERVRNEMTRDYLRWLRQQNPSQSWEEIRQSRNIEGEINQLFGSWVMTKYARQPIDMARQMKQDIGGFSEAMRKDFESGAMQDRVTGLPAAGWKLAADLLLGPQNPKTGLRNGGLWGFAAAEVEVHGPFSAITIPVKGAAKLIAGLGTNPGKYSAHYDAMKNMTAPEREKYLRDNAADIPYLGPMYEWINAVEKNDNKKMSELSFKMALDTANSMYDLGDLRLRSRPKAADIAVEMGAMRSEVATKYILEDIRRTAAEVAPKISAERLAARDALLARAQRTDVRLSVDEASQLLGIDRNILLERQGTILQYSGGDRRKGMFTAYKLGDENALVSQALRTERPDMWTGKFNPVDDKSWKPGEELLVSPEDLARFEQHPPIASEIVNYKPRQFTPEERAALPPDLQSKLLAREKDASNWDGYTADHPKVIDYSDPDVVQKYGPMYVAEDAGKPAVKAEFWRDPEDLRIYVRYQTADGTWSAPRRQSSDIDTIAHGPGEGPASPLTYEQETALGGKQSFGQIGEGDSDRWAQSMLQRDSDGSWSLKDPAQVGQFIKAVDTLTKGSKELILRQDLDGLRLTRQEFPTLPKLREAAAKLDAAGRLTPEQRASLVGFGALPPK